MGWLDRLFPTRAQALIVLWEERVKPDLEAEIAAWPEEKKEEKATMRAFLKITESRIVAQAVRGSVSPPHVDKPKGFARKA